MMHLDDKEWQTFAKKATAYVGFPFDNYTIPLHDVPLFSAPSESEEKFACLVIDEVHKWSFHFRKSLRENYNLPSDRALIIFRGVLKEKFPDGKWKPIDSFKYEFLFDGNDITFERELLSDIHKKQESFLIQMGKL